MTSFRVMPFLALIVALRLSAAGRDLAPRRLDTPIGNIGTNVKTIANGSTILWLSTIENFRAGKHVYAAITDPSGAIRVPAMPVWPYIDQYTFGATATPSGYLLSRGGMSKNEQRTLADDGQLGAVIQVPLLPADATRLARPPMDVTLTAVVQEAPKIASDGSGFLAVWTERGGTAQAIVAQRLDANGSPSGSPLEVIRTGGILGDHAVAFGGGQYLVIWQNGSQIFGMRVTPSGAPIDTTPFVVATIDAPSRFGIASDGDSFLVTWGYGAVISGAVVTAAGHVSTARPLITSADQLLRRDPVAAFDGFRYIVASLTDRISLFPCGCPSDTRVEVVRVGRDGIALDPQPAVIQPERHNANHLNIASSLHGDAMITFASYNTVLAASLHDDASLRADAPVTLFEWFDLVAPSITWTNGAYLVAFRYPSALSDFDGHGEWYLGTTRVGTGDVASTITGPPHELEVESPGLATNAAGDAVIAISEARSPGVSPRAVGYALDDLHAATPPAAPAITWQQSTDGGNLIVSWPHVAADERGFYLTLYGRHSQPIQRWFPPGTAGTSVPWPADLASFELLVWTEGGFVSTKISAVPPRARAARH